MLMRLELYPLKGGCVLRNNQKNASNHTSGRGMNAKWCRATVCMFLLAAPLVAEGSSISGESNTIVRAKEVGEERKILPVYEYLDLSVKDVSMPGLSFHAGAWGRLDLTDQGSGSRTGGDLQHGYLQYRGEKANAGAKLGRLTVFEGVAAERIDGISGGLDLLGGFRASAFLGKPVESSPNYEAGSFIYGGRLSHQFSKYSVLGVSALQETVDGSRAREDVGIDLSVTPHRMINLTGRSVYNALSEGWKENNYNLSLGPFENVTFNGEISQIKYKDYFDHLTTRAFRTLGNLINADEELILIGDTLTLEFPEKGSIAVDFKNYSYAIAGDANYFGAKAIYNYAKDGTVGAAVHRMSGANDKLDYMEYRLYALKKFGNFGLTADFFDVKYDKPINNVSNTYSFTVAGSYEVSHSTTVSADVDYFRSPDFSDGVSLLAKVQIKF